MPVRPNGTIVADLDHDTFGNREIAVESFAQPFGYTGREYDADTGLYHYRAGEYDPVAGRFLQEDPLHIKGGDFNLYRYALGNPLRYLDPSGRTVIEYGNVSKSTVSKAGSIMGLGEAMACTFNSLSGAFSAALASPSIGVLVVEVTSTTLGCGFESLSPQNKGHAANRLIKSVVQQNPNGSINGKRPDILDYLEKVCAEIKTFTPANEKKMGKQVGTYVKMLQGRDGG